MDNNRLDKLIKPYWDYKFKNCFLGNKQMNNTNWYGLCVKNPDYSVSLITGNYSNDNSNMWVYSYWRFGGHNEFFNLNITQFNESMVRYINKTYKSAFLCSFMVKKTFDVSNIFGLQDLEVFF
jgi:hypothetical protein